MSLPIQIQLDLIRDMQNLIHRVRFSDLDSQLTSEDNRELDKLSRRTVFLKSVLLNSPEGRRYLLGGRDEHIILEPSCLPSEAAYYAGLGLKQGGES